MIAAAQAATAKRKAHRKPTAPRSSVHDSAKKGRASQTGTRPFFCGASSESRRPATYLAAITFPMTVPITSPEMTISTRRFCCRPEAESLEAIGRVSPKPFVVTELSDMP